MDIATSQDVFSIGFIEEKVRSNIAITDDEARFLWANASLGELGHLAQISRNQLNRAGIVTYLIDRNINYTNVCNTDCSFCGFYRHDPSNPESYVLSKEIIGKKIEEALELGATRILLQGGHNDQLPFSFYTELLTWIKSKYNISLNAYSPSEVHQMHLVSGLPYKTILEQLKDAGLDGLPGGGAEILDDEIRKKVSPKKISADLWIDIMKVAHSLGLVTTASMVIGFGETFENRLNHLRRLRECQLESLSLYNNGFSAFISWPLQHNENTSMGRSKRSDDLGASPSEHIRHAAISRIYLNNIKHHQASWPTLGPEVASIALHMGCDDFGSTMIEENVVSQAGGASMTRSVLLPEEMQDYIIKAGFTPVERNFRFEAV